MEDKGELSPGWRFLLALAIVFGIVTLGLLLVYTWFLLAPLVLAVLIVVLGVRWVVRR